MRRRRERTGCEYIGGQRRATTATPTPVATSTVATAASSAAAKASANNSTAAQLLAAFSKAVGPAPTFAPAALALVALVLIVATQRHPALRV